ncbi:MAG: transporter substrate-binding domain-containing protein, partial [Shewanella sp.]
MIRFMCVIMSVFILTACQQAAVDDGDIPPKKITELRVGTLYGPQIFMTSGQGNSGFDYDMAVLFAEYLDVPLTMQPYTNRADLFEALRRNEIDIIAAGMTDTPARREQFRLGPPLYRVNQVLAYREGKPMPKDISNLNGKITVMAESSFVETLIQLQKRYPSLTWEQVTDKDSDELLAMIANKEIDYTIV